MTEVRKTERFGRWLDGLRDLRGRARIQARIERLAAGNPGDVAPVGEGVSEMRIDVAVRDIACTSRSKAEPSSFFLLAEARTPRRRISGRR